MIEFQPFPKIGRLTRNCVITEKIDGTNAQIIIDEDNNIGAASRNRLIYPGKQDNAGFAEWVENNKEELLTLGTGRHFGEWYGKGIQRHYNLTEQRFALFNVSRWNKANIPSCCEVVPVLWSGNFYTNEIDKVMNELKDSGSLAVPNFMNPEGIIIFHSGTNTLFKRTFELDEGKWNEHET